MHLQILISFATVVVAYAILRVVGVHMHIFKTSRFPPQVPTLFAGYDNGLQYVMNPVAFLSQCQRKCGPVYRVSLGTWRLIVVSSADSISSVFSAPRNLLRNDIMHKEMFYVVSGITKYTYAHLHGIMVRELYPLVDKSLSPRSLGQTMQGFGLLLLSQVNTFVQNQSGAVSLVQLTGEPLYIATNTILLGDAFPSNTYREFQTLNKSVPYRFARTLLWPWSRSSYVARMRILKTLQDYLQQGEATGSDNQFSRGFMKVFKDNNIQSLEGAQLVLNFLWGVHSNTMSNSFFMISFLMDDPTAFARIRSEIDHAVKRFGTLEALLEAGPEAVDDPAFILLTSAVMETMRLTSLHAGVRQASCDFELGLKDGSTVSIKEGEYLFGNVHTAHMDATAFPDPHCFVVDRFARRQYRRKYLQTEGYPFHSLGGGRHICKGRWLAVYEIKVLVMILLHTFEFSTTKEDPTVTSWRLPRIHPRSIGVIHTEDDVFLRLSFRKLAEERR